MKALAQVVEGARGQEEVPMSFEVEGEVEGEREEGCWWPPLEVVYKKAHLIYILEGG